MADIKIENGKAKKTFSVKKAAVIGLILLLLAAIGVLIYFLLREDEPAILPGPVPGGRGIVAVPGNIDRLGATVQDGSYEATMNVEWEFDSWDKPSTTAFVANTPSNTRTVYFDLMLGDDLIYSSPFIPVGGVVEKFALDQEVPAGEHTAVVIYHLVDDDYNEISTVAVSVTLLIAN